MRVSDSLAAAAMNAIKEHIPSAKLYYFAGPVPASPDDALDMDSQHTQCVAITLNGDGSGLAFETPTGAVLSKKVEDKWEGEISFDGAQSDQETLTPTFFRIGDINDNCRGPAGAKGRIQGTIGGPGSSADIRLSDGTTVTKGHGNKRSLPLFTIRMVTI